ncbi:MAG: recombinase zinc beta ribbon domain-containing protein [Mogibacterium sp.]|nr:recombinase zinc beta ribbon domain-containing protein [Mogibacterium sp.]
MEGSHKAIIDLDTYNRVQAEMERRREKHYGASRRKKKYPLSSNVCGICGKNYRHRVTSTDGKWVCSTFFTKGKEACTSKQIPDSVLMHIAAEHGGADEIERIIANPGNELIFILRGGSEHRHIWQDRSRSESLTPEMKEKARQKAKEQHKCRRTSQ